MAVKFELDPKTLRKVRSAVKPTGSRGSWLARMGDDMLIELYGRVRSGEGYKKIARRYQEKYGYCPDANLNAMAQAVKKFAEKVLPSSHIPRDPTADKPPGKKTKKEKARAEQRNVWDKHVEEINKEFAALDRMIQAAELQWKRIELLTRTESDWGTVSQNADKMIERFFQYADKILERQMKLGIVDSKAPKKILELRGGFKVESPDMVVEAMGQFLNAVQEEALLLRPSESGRYQLPEATDARPRDDEQIPSREDREGFTP